MDAMPAPISKELREEILSLYRGGMTQAEIEVLLGVGRSTVMRTIKRHAPEIARKTSSWLSDDQKAEIIRLFDKGLRYSQIRRAFDPMPGIPAVKKVIADSGREVVKRPYDSKVPCPDPLKLQEMLLDENVGVSDIAHEFGVSKLLISKWIKRYSLSKVRKSLPSKFDEHTVSLLENKTWMAEQYHALGTVKLGKKLGVTDGTVGRYLEKHGIDRDAVLSRPTSQGEQELSLFLEGFGEVICNSRKIIAPYEIDAFMPDHNLAVEYNGLYWHTEEHKGKTYHFDKWKMCADKGIQLIQVWEDDWVYKRPIVESMLKHKMGKSDMARASARKCAVVAIDHASAAEFLTAYHLQGKASGSHYLALEYDGSLVAVMVFASRGGSEFTLSRYASSCVVRGGFSKLLRAFEGIASPSKIVTFADLAVSDGSLYINNGFSQDKLLQPDYKYLVARQVRVHKANFRKANFRSNPDLKYEDGMTERELAALNDLPRIYDAGKIRFVKECAL